MMGTRAVSRRHGNGGEKALFYLIITLQYVELFACIIEIAGSIYLAVRGPGDSVAVIASIAMLIASSTSLCVLVVHQLAAKSLQGQSSREYQRRQHSLRGIMGSFLILLLIAWTTAGVFSIIEVTRSAGCQESGDVSRYWRSMVSCVVQKATLAIALLMIIVTLALLAAIFTLENAFAASLSGLHRRNHTEEEELHLSNHPIYANVTVTPYREKRIKAPLFNDTTPNFDPIYSNDSPTSIDTSSPTPRPLDPVMTSPSQGPDDVGKKKHSRQRSWLPPLKFHEHTVTLHPALQSTSTVNLLPSPINKPSDAPYPTHHHPTPAAGSMPDLSTPPPRPKPPASKPPFRSAALTRTKTAASMASSIYSRHTNNTTSMTCTAQSDEDDTVFSRQPSLSSLSMSSQGSPYATMKTPTTAKSFIRHPATRNPFATKVAKPGATAKAMKVTAEPKKVKARPLPIIGPTSNPFLDSPGATNTTTPASPPKSNNSSSGTPSRPHTSPSLPPSKFWLYARSIQRSANANNAVAAVAVGQDGAFPNFPLPLPSLSPNKPAKDSSPGRRRSNTAPSTGSPRHSPALEAPPHEAGVAAPVEEGGEAGLESIHPAFRNIDATSLGVEGTLEGESGRRGDGGGDDVLAAGAQQAQQRSEYERLCKSSMGGAGGVPLGEVLGRSKSELLRKKKGGRMGGGMNGGR